MSSRITIKDQAIILRKQPFGEADVMLTLFTVGHGKLRVLAKGARRPSSRLVGHTEPFSIISGQVALATAIPILSQVTVDHTIIGLAEDPLALQRVSLLAEIVDKSLAEGEANEAIYRLLVEGSLRIRTTDHALLFAGIVLRLLALLGYAPEMTHCVICKLPLVEGGKYGWSHESGGVVANDCLHVSGLRAEPIESDALKALRFLQRQPLNTMERLASPPQLSGQLCDLIVNYCRIVLEQPLVSAMTA